MFDDVARTVHELFRDRDAHDELGARELAEEFVVSADGGLAVKPDPMWGFEVDEQQSDLGGGGDVAHGEEHAVAVVAGEGDRGRIEDFHEAGRPALVRDGGEAVGSHRREEEEFSASQEVGCVVIEFGLDGDGLERVGKRPRVEVVLECSMVLVVEAHERAVSALPLSSATPAARSS